MMIQAARMVSPGVIFEVHIHRTGSVPDGYTVGKVPMDFPNITKFTREETEEVSINDEIDVDDPSTWPAKKVSDKKLADTDKELQDSSSSIIVDERSTTSTGFAMELAHMMSGRYNEICQNLALFSAFTTLIWSGQWICFHFDVVKTAQLNYNPYTAFWISNLIWLTTVFFWVMLN